MRNKHNSGKIATVVVPLLRHLFHPANSIPDNITFPINNEILNVYTENNRIVWTGAAAPSLRGGFNSVTIRLWGNSSEMCLILTRVNNQIYVLIFIDETKLFIF